MTQAKWFYTPAQYAYNKEITLNEKEKLNKASDEALRSFMLSGGKIEVLKYRHPQW